MKNIRSLVKGLVVSGLALAMVTTTMAQAPATGSAKVIRIKGSARYTTGNNVWLPVKVGQVLRPGTVIQTTQERGSFVELALGEGSGVASMPTATTIANSSSASPPPDVTYYQPTSDQNIVRLWEDTILGIDKLTTMDTGADVVSETQLDLRRGRLFGQVKKMSAASKYEVKIPNGVAGIRGTIYEITAEGVVRVLVGSVVMAYVGADGTVVTQVVMGGQQFDSRSGQVTPIPQYDQKEMVKAAKAARVGPNTPPTTFTVDHTIYYVSPTIGHNGNAGANSGNNNNNGNDTGGE